MTDDLETEPTDPLFDLLLQKFMPDFTVLADSLGIPNDELERVANDMAEQRNPLGETFAFFLRNTVHTRRMVALTALMRPGEECVTIQELVEREARTKGSA